MKLVFGCFVVIVWFINTYALHFVAYGDSRTGATVHQSIVNAFAKENPELVVHSGDLWDGYSSSTWKSHLTGNATINALLITNKFLVAMGNHETSSEVLGFSPAIVRNSSITYSFMGCALEIM